MLSDIESVKSVVRAAIDPAQPPNRAQVSEISRLTYFDEPRKEVQRVIERRLKYPYSYHSLEVLHTLQLIQHCFADASLDFLTFCVVQTLFIANLQHYEAGGIPVAQEIAFNARILTKVLNRSVPPSDMRKAMMAWTASTVPYRNPPTKQKKSSPWTVASMIPPPESSRKHVKVTFQDDNSEPQTSESVLLRQKEDVAMMTFQSGDEGLDTTLNAVDELIIPTASVTSHPDELVRALECVFHCLYWGSAPFLEKCGEKKPIFDLLCHHADPKIRGCANKIFMFLTERSPVQDEKLSRYPLIPRSVMASIIPIVPPHSDVARKGVQPILLEPSLDISRTVMRTETSSFTKGLYHTTAGVQPVSIKFLRTLGKRRVALHKRLSDTFLAWRTLSHMNIAPFYGVVLEGDAIGLVSPLYPKGNVLEYIKIHWDINPLYMLQGIVDGVLYLHAKEMVHGDIRCRNVMVSDTGTPCLTDFGVFQLLDGAVERTGDSYRSLASLRWSAPEICISVVSDSPVSAKTEKSDVYALASTCIELIMLEAPYQGLSDQQVLEHVVIDKRFPVRPSLKTKYLSDDLWSLLTTCWNTQPQDRPNIVAVRRKLAEVIENDSRGTVLKRKRGFKWPAWIERGLG